MGGNWGCQDREQAGKAASAPAYGCPSQTELWWVITLLHPSTWNQGRQRVVAGLVPSEAQPQGKCILCVPRK